MATTASCGRNQSTVDGRPDDAVQRASRRITANSREGAIRRSQAFLRRKSMMRISDFRRGFPRCFYPMDPDEGASAWQRKRNGRDLVRPTTTDRLTAYLSILESCGLLKPSVDSLLAHRPSLWPLPMTTNRGDDSNVGNGSPKLGLAFLNQRHSHPVWLICTGDDEVPGFASTGTECVGRPMN